MFRKIFHKYKKLIIAVIVFAVIVLISFIATVISVSKHENKANNSTSKAVSEQIENLSTTITSTTPVRNISPYSTDYDKSLEDIKDVFANNKWRGKGKYNVDEGKDYSFSFGKDDIAVISSPQEKEKVLINMKYVKSVIGKYNTYRIVCDLSFQDGKYITDSTLILTFKESAYELRCDDFPLYQRFCIKEW